jgi:glycosyltransferase involved in cell wall biosynthesis
MVPVRDSEALAQAMNEFLQLDNDARIKMGKAGRIKVLNEFDDRIIADQLYDIIKLATRS